MCIDIRDYSEFDGRKRGQREIVSDREKSGPRWHCTKEQV